jgi:hypothetical protein
VGVVSDKALGARRKRDQDFSEIIPAPTPPFQLASEFPEPFSPALAELTR